MSINKAVGQIWQMRESERTYKLLRYEDHHTYDPRWYCSRYPDEANREVGYWTDNQFINLIYVGIVENNIPRKSYNRLSFL